MLLSVRLRFFPYLKNLNSKLYFKPQQWGTLCTYHRKRITSPMVFFYLLFFLKRWWYHIFHTCFSYILLHVRPPNIHQLTNDPSRVKVWLHFCCLKCQPWMFFPPLKLSHWKFVFCNFFEKQKTKNKTFWCARIFSTLSALNFWKSTYSENTELVHLG